jgi:hypothetical protein
MPPRRRPKRPVPERLPSYCVCCALASAALSAAAAKECGIFYAASAGALRDTQPPLTPARAASGRRWIGVMSSRPPPAASPAFKMAAAEVGSSVADEGQACSKEPAS